MEPTCKLHAKCLKADEGLEKRYMPKMLLKTFGKEEWESLLLCGKQCFKHQKKSLTNVKSRIPMRVPWSSDGLVDEFYVCPNRLADNC